MSIILIALLVYSLFLLAFAIYSAFAIYHLWQFGYVGDLCKPVAIGYLVAAGAIIFFTLVFTLGTLI